jgi:hypothetical protein
MYKQFALAVMVCRSSPAFMATTVRTSMHHQLKLPVIRSLKFTKCLPAGLSSKAFRTLESASYRSVHAMSDRGVRQYADDESGSCLTARPPKGLLWNVLFRFVLGDVLSWQLMKHYPNGTRQSGSSAHRKSCESRTEKKRQKLKAQIKKMERRSEQRPYRICGICLYQRVLKGNPVAMVRYGPGMSRTRVRTY